MKTLNNSVQLIGVLGTDPQVKELSNGQKMARLLIATTDQYSNPKGDKTSRTYWHYVVAWGKMAEVAGKYLRKGSRLAVKGRLISTNYEDSQGNRRYVSQVVVNDLMMLDRRN